MRRLLVHLEPALCQPHELTGAVAVVIDVLRATTTMIYALAASAREIRPCVSVEHARELSAGFAPGTALLGGERQGVRIDGFDLGNSPAEYDVATVRGKTILFTTTNGTRALDHARQARCILVAGFVNARAVVDRLEKSTGDIQLLCAGTDRRPTREDVLLAGLLLSRLLENHAAGGPELALGNDEAALSLAVWRQAVADRDEANRATSGRAPTHAERDWLADELAHSLGGRNLLTLNLAADLRAAAALDRFQIVPVYDPKSDTVRVAVD